MELQIDTKPLLRPQQLADAQDERASLDRKLRNPNIQDKGEVSRQLRRLDTTLAAQTPKAFVGVEKDAAVKMEAELRDKWQTGMPSQEEMRKNPVGAVDKHIAWEKRNKEDVLRWKNLQLRLNVGNPDSSVTNIEQYRPKTSSLNMDGAQIGGKMIFLPDGGKPAVTFTEEQLAVLAQLAPDIRDKMALLSAEQRADVKQTITGQMLKRA